ncbi:DgyrCDS10859 [Dimorphilus gyrociliatus]|uniref:DgyrCDS10859 n=1 Tax=Dimorphilus gyrociliatus TaxID=2664684 RepID=A0A7I8W1N0_9ANNE|nr:DgyrCDS10859 [Dimorphilus gyrociliatus]
MKTIFLIVCTELFIFTLINTAKEDEKWKKKDVRDYTDADLERLYDQWEDTDPDELSEDELPDYKKRPPPIYEKDIRNVKDPEEVLKMSKKGRVIMLFVTVSGDPTERETNDITRLWHGSLFNAHFDIQRYVIEKNRAIFSVPDGSKAWDVKDFLIKQDRCLLVTIDGKEYYGKAHSKFEDGKKSTKLKKDEF